MYFDAATVKEAARGRWIDLLAQLGVGSEYLRNVHGPCPGCGGRDRFRFDDQEGNGTFLCSQGGGGLLTGDGFTLLEHIKKWDFSRCVSEIGELLNLQAGRPPPPSQRTPPKPVEPKPEFSQTKLGRTGARFREFVNSAWLADRSPVNPYRLTSEDFLRMLYRLGEKVIVFTDHRTQGQAVWPDEKLPTSGPEGVWFLAQPVDGKYHPNPRRFDKATNKHVESRRSEESVVAWRYLVIESDKANPYDWIATLVQFPLAIAAIYTSGRRSIHALVRVDADSLEHWRGFARMIHRVLVILGADKQVASTAVRLSRLPGCLRAGRLQKLLYLNAEPLVKPIVAMPRVRNVLQSAIERAQATKLGAGDVIANANAKSLDDCIAALDAHELLKGSDSTAAKDLLTWFESAPAARDALALLP